MFATKFLIKGKRQKIKKILAINSFTKNFITCFIKSAKRISYNRYVSPKSCVTWLLTFLVFCGYRVLQLSPWFKNSWNWNFANFRDLVLILLPEEFIKKVFLKMLQYSQEKTCLFLFNSIRKDTLAQGFSCEFHKIFRNTFFTVPLWITASILQPEKIIRISQRFYRFRFIFFFIFYFFIYFFSFSKCLFTFQLSKAFAVLWAANHFVG